MLENPAWYTAYTPYQPEISQGRLEALVNFQTMVCDLTGMAIANASMLDEATAAAEAMTLCQRIGGARSPRGSSSPTTSSRRPLDVVRTRAKPLGVEVVTGPAADAAKAGAFAVLLQYPGANGDVRDYAAVVDAVHADGGHVVVAADLLALTLLAPPGEWGADVVVGSAQRFGVPMGYGGPHAGYLATRDDFKRTMPGRLVGVTIDANGAPAYRLALQTREQHIRREKATSNICTAQVLLAVIAGMYAVYHGPEGLTTIARRVHRLTSILRAGLERLGQRVPTAHFFDTIMVATGAATDEIMGRALALGMNFRRIDARTVGLSLDETTTRADVEAIWRAFGGAATALPEDVFVETADALPDGLRRRSAFLVHPTFNRYHSETEMLRYLRRLADRDIALDRAMIPLGSCTMKLNATSEMIPVTWPEFGALHPFAPDDQAEGYRELVRDLERMLCAATGYAAVSLQPNAGSQGEYAGLLVIQAYHASRGEGHRDVCLIPASAHGTNPASAHMAGMRVVVVACDGDGNVDIADLEARAREHSANLAAIMVTYPSTHGVFEAGIRRICEIVHAHGGQVYVDGANLNALVGLAAPGRIRGRRLAPQPAQDVLHSARRRRTRGGPDRRRGAPRAVPAGPSLPAPACGCDRPSRPRRMDWRGLRRAVWLGVDPADLVDVHRDDGRRRAEGGDRKRDPRRELHREAARCTFSRALRRPRGPGGARVHPGSAAAQGSKRHRGRRRREAADRLRLSCPDDELPRPRHADDRADGKRIEG